MYFFTGDWLRFVAPVSRPAVLWASSPASAPDHGKIKVLQYSKLEARSNKLEAETHPRYLGLDVGNRRIGVAVSDELGLTAQPVLTLERRHNQREDLRSLARLCRRFGVVGIVVGNPVHLSGDLSPQAAKTQAFAAELGALTGLPIHLWDERLTSREAHQILYEAGHPRQEHRRVVDQVAATLILQSFLEQSPPALPAAMQTGTISLGCSGHAWYTPRISLLSFIPPGGRRRK
jgi:putative Holliday junction resolvase